MFVFEGVVVALIKITTRGRIPCVLPINVSEHMNVFSIAIRVLSKPPSFHLSRPLSLLPLSIYKHSLTNISEKLIPTRL